VKGPFGIFKNGKLVLILHGEHKIWKNSALRT